VRKESNHKSAGYRLPVEILKKNVTLHSDCITKLIKTILTDTGLIDVDTIFYIPDIHDFGVDWKPFN